MISRVTITLTLDNAEQIARRGDNRSGEINHALARYFRLIDRADLILQKLFTAREWAVIRQALNNPDLYSVEFIDRAIELHFPTHLPRGVNGNDLLNRLRALTLVEKMALDELVKIQLRSRAK